LVKNTLLKLFDQPLARLWCYGLLAMLGALVTVSSPSSAQDAPQKVELLQCDALDGGMFNGQSIVKLLGNVVFKQGDALLYCDSAYQYKSVNKLEAFSNVRLKQGDTLSCFGDKLVYEGESRKTVLSGKVRLENKTTTLVTDLLNYDLSTRTATYTTGGVITDKGSTIKSKKGRYEASTSVLYFRDSVEVTDRDSRIETDTLVYEIKPKRAIFVGPTRIFDSDGVLYAESGEYYLDSKLSNFSGRVSMETDKYFLSADQVRYDQLQQIGKASGKVLMVSKTDNIRIHGAEARYNKFTGITLVYGSPYMETPMDNDTLFLGADTLISIERKAENFRLLIAYYRVKLFKQDMQGLADSLVYRFTDSTIHFYRNPVLWSKSNQLTSDSLYVQMANQTIDKMYMTDRALMISEDTLGYYNQLAGRKMIAHFDSGKIDFVEVHGNGESIYHALKEDTVLMGLNKVQCSDMRIQFYQNELQAITFYVQPDAVFIPPKEIEPDETKLKGFDWKIQLRPRKEDITDVGTL
jgi:lipopolysaccharide export system protein LptA